MSLHVSLGLVALALSGTSSALIGYGVSKYDPLCAHSCQQSFKSTLLTCSSRKTGEGDHDSVKTTAKCRSTNTPWLTTLAYCMNSTCANYSVEPWQLEKFWTAKCTGDPKVHPKWTYGEALTKIEIGAKFPTVGAEKNKMLNSTAQVDRDTWEGYMETLGQIERSETIAARNGIILLVIGFGTPIFFTLFGYLPYMSGLLDKLKPRLIYPAFLGNYHVRALPFALGNAPTTGQALYVAMFISVNIILTAVGYQSRQPNMKFSNRWEEIVDYVACRTGILACALAPLVILFASRNNILLWVTNWSHSTYMTLHRWVARIFAVQAILHSILELVLHQATGEAAAEMKELYWIWGIVATVSISIMMVISTLFFRRLSYEIFLVLHVLLAVFVIVGIWYHLEFAFKRRWGYEQWIYAACAVWFFDRILRVSRVLKNGIRRANVTEIGDNIVRVDIKNVRWGTEPGQHTYAYFPTLNPLRPWENHPFSVIPTALLSSPSKSPIEFPVDPLPSKHLGSNDDIEKIGAVSILTQSTLGGNTAGVSLYVRKSAGLTKALATNSSLFTLLDGPYQNSSLSAILKTDRLVLIAGGIGITAVLPFIARHRNVKLHWSVASNSDGLVKDMDAVLKTVKERDIRIGSRLNLASLLDDEEIAGWARVGVVVCGPGGLCDDVRKLVCHKGQAGKTVWELDVEAFSW
ncbi:ferric reductase transmembrane component 4 [Lindgomyces ingoldianus]|uniref:Ferric reductase transmembrane component 4 n=1 Tax=Lindgomyces ingoldianus TaxID=673940 RepID=A0ACB6R7S7_9PLEO|nr:ferric reductase transmembrane component 4 [Lindgomyces ingoldianus]KAF2475226.1 ferric reductase transmembrane component 4 [Lindgomyces ingoldianus]